MLPARAFSSMAEDTSWEKGRGIGSQGQPADLLRASFCFSSRGRFPGPKVDGKARRAVIIFETQIFSCHGYLVTCDEMMDDYPFCIFSLSVKLFSHRCPHLCQPSGVARGCLLEICLKLNELGARSPQEPPLPKLPTRPCGHSTARPGIANADHSTVQPARHPPALL